MGPRMTSSGGSVEAAAVAEPHGESHDADMAGFAKGGLINLAGSLVQGLSSLVISTAITRGVGSEALAGAFFQAVALFNILAATSKLGADTGLVRQIPHWRQLGRSGDVRQLLRLSVGPVLALGMLAGALLWAFAEPLARVLGEGEGGAAVADYARILAFIVPAGALQMTLVSASRGFGDMVPSNVSDRLVRPILQIVLIAIALVLDTGAVGIALGWGIPFLVSGVQILRWVQRDVAALPEVNENGSTASMKTLAVEFWSFTAPRALAGFFQVGILWLDVVLVGVLATQADAGRYGAATRLLIIGSFVQLAVIHAIQPRVTTALARDDLDRARTLFRTGTSWVVTAVWPIYIGMAVFAPFLLGLFGPEYVQAADALRILCIAWLVSTACGPVDTVLNMSGRSGWSMIDLFIALVVNVVGNIVLVPSMGIEGAALAWGASMLVHNLLPLLQVQMFLGINPFGRAWITAIPIATVIVGGGALAAVAVAGQTFVGLLLGALPGLAYLGIIWTRRNVLGLDALRR